ncbi:hypoxanthine phosphoribosyltransferase [Anaerobacterium chartisolvens]|uniref:Hypoxanthine phosphoribosyltransferase n=1 Tax=Anaerobacterium chartisolvens TaxID=1297424 RepID=A0A369BKC0_9FIRM|nr:hypoxanthine phosphoribosyltransferase [Anaerobacterium chartisolvens]RCX21026.1 hypoxanthine phosphoribosyltransferase [Anaerobacterium chartisolvens]
MEGIKGVLIGRDMLLKKAEELGTQISRDYREKELVLVGVLKGGFVFLADLMRHITIPVDMDFISVSSYGHSTRSSGVVRIIKDIDINITGKHVLIVEDLVDTGLTLKHLKELLNTRGPLSVRICTALDKPSRRKVEIEVEYKGIVIPDEFVVGYGLDYGGKYRNLPDLCTLDPKACKK